MQLFSFILCFTILRWIGDGSGMDRGWIRDPNRQFHIMFSRIAVGSGMDRRSQSYASYYVLEDWCWIGAGVPPPMRATPRRLRATGLRITLGFEMAGSESNSSPRVATTGTTGDVAKTTTPSSEHAESRCALRALLEADALHCRPRSKTALLVALEEMRGTLH